MEYKLSANYDSRNSFYGKATVIENDEKTELKSYNIIVAYIKDDKAVVNGQYNQTTLRHIKEFLKQHGFTAECRKQIEEDYSPTEVNDEKNLKEEKKQKEEESNNMLKTVGMIASLGEVFCDNKKDSNDWKTRMLKAGLENKGLVMPDNWDSLPEDEKERRLNGVIKESV